MKKIRAILILLLIIIIGIVLWYFISVSPKSSNIKEKEVTIPIGTGSSGIAEILKENNIIKSETAFKIYVKLNKVSGFQAGTYYLKESMSVKEITEMLKTGIMHDPNQVTITFIEGKNFRWIANTIAEKTNNTYDEVLAVLEDDEYINYLIGKYWFLEDDIKDENIYYSLEGYLFPDTYAIKNKDVEVREILEKMLDQMGIVLEDYKEEIEDSEYSIHEILTIASIIETESMTQEGRKDVASVIYNRLNSNMAIQSDVTTYYAIKVDMSERDLYQREIDAYNPYNTRGPNMEGKLPIGPMSTVSRSSIEAALEPNNTDYIFFVADKNGKLYFTKTNEEHNAKVIELKTQGLWWEY
ncbi:MAG: endolytic transglycosylase MltG [Clostridiales bacterium]|nr:endolytic transglycosylase MltG [Clostridiales bacterium]